MAAPHVLPFPGWVRRLGWLLAIWVASVLALALAAGAMKLLMRAIGMGH